MANNSSGHTHLHRRVASIFRGIDRWPNLPVLVCREAYRIFHTDGLSGFTLAGGRLQEDGVATLGQDSIVARDLVVRVLAEHPGFWFRDDQGVEWVVRVTQSPTNDRPGTGWAMTFPVGPRLLDRAVRRAAMRDAKQGSTRAAPTARASKRNGRQRLKADPYSQCWAEELELALELLPRILDLAAQPAADTGVMITIDGMNRSVDERRSRLATLLKRLVVLATIETAQVELAATGWGINLRRRLPAISQIAPVGEVATQFIVSPQLGAAINAFAQPWQA